MPNSSGRSFDVTNIHPRTPEFKSRAIAETQISGTAHIRPEAGGTFRYDPKGQPATTLGVNDRHGNLVDVVAWCDDSRHWWLRRGDQTPILGARALAIAAWHGEPVKIHCTPEGWFQAIERASGTDTTARICILQPGADLRPLLDGVSRVDCETADLEDMLRRDLRAWEPKITSPPKAARHAA